MGACVALAFSSRQLMVIYRGGELQNSWTYITIACFALALGIITLFANVLNPIPSVMYMGYYIIILGIMMLMLGIQKQVRFFKKFTPPKEKQIADAKKQSMTMSQEQGP
jgi:uncharacterized membrane protein HdeD (DUF308 family)